MSVSFRHIFRQGPVLRSLASVAVAAAKQKWSTAQTKETPGPWFEEIIAPRSPKLVVDYIRWTGGDFGRYDHVLPPHLFPQWGFPLVAKTLDGIPYPLIGVLNQGCRITRNSPLPKEELLHLKARLESIDDNGQRARLHQRLITGTATEPEALITDLYSVVKLRSSDGSKHRDRPELPEEASQLGSRYFHDKAGRDFALLTGDFNPIHWLKPAAKASGFKNTILHGFASLGTTLELLNAHLEAKGAPPWKSIDVRFIRPFVLPNTATMYVVPKPEIPAQTESGEANEASGQLFSVDQAGEIYMLGSYE